MNTEVLLLAPFGDPRFEEAGQAARETFEAIEACLSRFRPESELSELNRSAGIPFRASPLLFEAVSLALRAANETRGIFDPTVLPALKAAGYDRSFEEIDGSGALRSRQYAMPDFRNVALDPASSSIALAREQEVDLGGIGKGLAVDKAIDATNFVENRCINAGGDIAVRGSPDPMEQWLIDLEDAGNSAPLSVGLRNSALATSTVMKRSWASQEAMEHHLIDPGSGRPSTSPFRTVTVVAQTCAEADVAAKVALLMGKRGLPFLEERGIHGMAVLKDGSVLSTPQWAAA